MSISLLKEKSEKIGISLKKRGVSTVPKLRVVADYDVSASMVGLYRSGAVQTAADQVLGVAYKFDDNGEVDTFIFDSACQYIGTSGANDYGTFVSKQIMPKATWGSTNYKACFEKNVEFLFGSQTESAKKGFLGGIFGSKKESTPPPAQNKLPPGFVLFFTDGDPNSGQDGENVIKASLDKDVYFHLIGVGSDSSFAMLKRLADDYDNCGFVPISALHGNDQEMYDSLITEEFVGWLKTHGAS